MNNNIIILGDGLLGSEIRKQTNWDYISRKKDDFDICKPIDYYKISAYDQILNCIGYTKTYDENREQHWNINFKAVCALANWCSFNNKKLIHISTDYIYSGSKRNASENDVPVHTRNWYSYTKLLADGYIQAVMKDYLLIRTSFKKSPFLYEEAIKQRGNFDYVEIITDLIVKLINKNAIGVYNVGTKTKSMYDLAKQTNPDVIRTNKKIHETMPIDVTMNVNKMKEFLID